MRGGACIAYGAYSFIKVGPTTADRIDSQSRPKCMQRSKICDVGVKVALVKGLLNSCIACVAVLMNYSVWSLSMKSKLQTQKTVMKNDCLMAFTQDGQNCQVRTNLLILVKMTILISSNRVNFFKKNLPVIPVPLDQQLVELLS